MDGGRVRWFHESTSRLLTCDRTLWLIIHFISFPHFHPGTHSVSFWLLLVVFMWSVITFMMTCRSNDTNHYRDCYCPTWLKRLNCKCTRSTHCSDPVQLEAAVVLDESSRGHSGSPGGPVRALSLKVSPVPPEQVRMWESLARKPECETSVWTGNALHHSVCVCVCQTANIHRSRIWGTDESTWQHTGHAWDVMWCDEDRHEIPESKREHTEEHFVYFFCTI